MVVQFNVLEIIIMSIEAQAKPEMKRGVQYKCTQ